MENNVGMWKQEVMMMEIENEVFGEDDIDFDYEFHAPNFFDFTSQETPDQAQQAERWFETAATYAPSRSFFFNLSLSIINCFLILFCN
jgi:hypothetical protein